MSKTTQVERRWTVLATFPPNPGGFIVWRAVSDARMCNLEVQGTEPPTDEQFDEAFEFALLKHRAKNGGKR